MGTSEIASIRSDKTVLVSPKSFIPINFAPKNRHSVATDEKNSAYNTHLFKAAVASVPSFFPSALATSRMVARFIPDVAKVTAKPYIPERREYNPIASAPARLET